MLLNRAGIRVSFNWPAFSSGVRMHRPRAQAMHQNKSREHLSRIGGADMREPAKFDPAPQFGHTAQMRRS